MIKKIAAAVVALLFLIVGAAVVLPSFIDWNQYKQQAITAVRQASGYDISLDGPLSLAVLPLPHLQAEQVTVRLPGQSGSDYLARLDRLDVSVALIPLLKKKVEISGIKLIKPDIHLIVDKQGRQTWMTEQVAEKSAAQESSTGQGEGGAESGGVAVSVDRLEIENGSFSYTDQQKGTSYAVSDMQAGIRVESLQGPYRAEGKLTFRAVPLEFDLNVGARGSDHDLPIKANIGSPTYQTRASFGGVVKTKAPYDAQGQIDVTGEHWADAVSKLMGQAVPVPSLPLSVKGLLSANERSVVLEDLAFAYDALKLNGSVKVRLPDTPDQKPYVQANLSTKETVNLQKMMGLMGGAPAAMDQKTAQPAKTAAKPITMPKLAFPVDVEASLTAAGIQLAKEPFADVTVTLDAKGETVRAKLAAGKIPGQGKMSVTVYPGESGALMVDADLAATDALGLVRNGLGVALPVGVSVTKLENLKATMTAALSPSVVDIKSGSIQWRGGDLAIGGSSYRTMSGRKPSVVAVLHGQALDLDALGVTKPLATSTTTASKPAEGAVAPAASAGVKDKILTAVKAYQMPLDLTLDVDLGKLVAAGDTIKGLKVKTTLVGDRVDLGTLDVGDYRGVAVSAHGTIGSVTGLHDLDLQIKGEARDADAAMKTFGIAVPKTDRPLGMALVDLGYRGSLDKADVDLATTIWGLRVAGKGPVVDPLGTPKVDKVKISLTHDNAAEAIQLVQPSFRATAPLRGSLAVTADVSVAGKVYKIENLSGQAGTMTAKGNLEANLSAARPKLSGGLTLGDVPLDALMGVDRTAQPATAAVSATKAPKEKAARWSSAPLNTEWLRSMDLDFTIAAQSITYNMWVLSTPTLSMTLHDGALAVPDLKAGLFSGQIIANGQVKAPAGKPLSLSWQIDMKDVNVRSLTNALLNRVANKFEGTAALKVSLTSAGASPQELVGNLIGQASSTGKDVTINGIDVAKLVGWLTTDLKPSTTASALKGSLFSDGSTTFKAHRGAYTIQNGNITVDNMIFDGDQASITTTGVVSLPAWTIDTKSILLVKTPPNVPELTFALKGPLDNPAQNIGQGLFDNYVKQQLNNQVNKLLDKKLGKKLDDLGLGGLLGRGPATPTPETAPMTPETVEPAAPSDGTQSGAPTSQSAPVEQVQPAPAEQQKPEKIKPEDILRGVLQGISR